MRWTELTGAAASAPVPAPPATPSTPPVTPAARPSPRRPCADHPWRRGAEEFRIAQQLAAARRAYEAVNP